MIAPPNASQKGMSGEKEERSTEGDRSDPARIAALEHEVAALRRENDDLRQAAGLFCPGESMYRDLIHGIEFGFLILEAVRDRDGALLDFQCIDVNPATAAVMGRPRDEIVGRPVSAFYPAIDTSWTDLYARVLQKGKPEHGEYSSATGDRIADVTVYPLGSDRLAILAADITERRRTEEALRENEARYRTLVETALDIIIVHDREKILYINPTGLQLLGASRPDEILGKNPFDIIHPGSRDRVRENVAKDLRGERSPITQLQLLRRDGTPVWVEGHGIATCIGGSPAIQVIMRDISERRQMEEALLKSEERLRAVLENSLDAAYRRDLQTDRYDYMSPVIEQIVGYTAEEMCAMTIDEVVERIHPDDRPPVVAELARAIASGRGLLEYRFITKDGRYRWLADRFTVSRDAEGRPLYRSGIVRDITERKQAEKALRESEERFKAFMDNSPVIAWMKDYQGRYIYLNKTYQDRFGVQLEAWRGKTDSDLWPPGIAQRCMENDRTVLNGNRAIEIIEELRNPDGSSTYWWNIKFPLQDASRMSYIGGIGIDITDRKRAEDDLKEREEQLGNLIESSADGIVFTDEAGRITTWNRGMEHITGLAAHDVIGIPAWEIQSRIVDEEWAGPDHRTRYRAVWDQVLREGIYSRKNRLLDVQARTPNGEARYLQQSIFTIRTPRGFRIGCIMRDITENKRAEETLRERERILDSIFRAAPVGIGLVSNRVLMQVNDRLCQMTGYARDALIGKDARILYPSDEEYRFVGREKYARILKNGLGAVETRWRRKDGTTFDIMLSSSPVDPSRPYENVSFIALDITKLRENEKALKDYAEKLKRSNEDLERFAYVASHDLQEPLRTVVSFTQLLERRYKGQMGPEADEYIRFTVDAGKRMQTLITDLLEFSRVTTRGSAMSLVDTERIIAEVFANLQTKIADSDAVITCDPLPKVKADPSQLIQVFQNLVGNAIVFRREDGPPRIHISARQAGGMVQFSVADNGIGIEPQYFDRIFVIFQRLHGRERYPGTGIGLALCKRIIERHGGAIWLDSAPGKGSTFYFTLPAAQ